MTDAKTAIIISGGSMDVVLNNTSMGGSQCKVIDADRVANYLSLVLKI